jgi:hypothetical protein
MGADAFHEQALRKKQACSQIYGHYYSMDITILNQSHRSAQENSERHERNAHTENRCEQPAGLTDTLHLILLSRLAVENEYKRPKVPGKLL